MQERPKSGNLSPDFYIGAGGQSADSPAKLSQWEDVFPVLDMN